MMILVFSPISDKIDDVLFNEIISNLYSIAPVANKPGSASMWQQAHRDGAVYECESTGKDKGKPKRTPGKTEKISTTFSQKYYKMKDGARIKIPDNITKKEMAHFTRQTNSSIISITEAKELTVPGFIRCQNASISYKFHPTSIVQQVDFDAEMNYNSMGNGISTPTVNGKRCTKIVLEGGKTVSDREMDQLQAEINRTA